MRSLLFVAFVGVLAMAEPQPEVESHPEPFIPNQPEGGHRHEHGGKHEHHHHQPGFRGFIGMVREEFEKLNINPLEIIATFNAMRHMNPLQYQSAHELQEAITKLNPRIAEALGNVGHRMNHFVQRAMNRMSPQTHEVLNGISADFRVFVQSVAQRLKTLDQGTMERLRHDFPGVARLVDSPLMQSLGSQWFGQHPEPTPVPQAQPQPQEEMPMSETKKSRARGSTIAEHPGLFAKTPENRRHRHRHEEPTFQPAVMPQPAGLMAPTAEQQAQAPQQNGAPVNW